MNYVSKVMLFWVGVVMTMVLAGCDSPQATNAAADQVAEQFYAAVKGQDTEKVMSFYGEDFFNAQAPDGWREHLKKVWEKLGPLKGVRLKEKEVDTIYSGRRFLFVFINAYEKGNATETVVMMQKLDSPDIKIVMHKIDSMAL